ncbi:YbaK/EbsC family protein [Acuticoccus sediminis]|uniref:YbaK/EbsC family protein n=1 Tax=Acuticoccus sediminis TaxID=2184697 RepID=A0A8B2NW11_9HYPH|nr:YbaK/EbsC family protein [Acuticoccus sediminis]RAI03031.1 YbaK/EbsC family protein [Acuticoccus sediminis]
MSETANPTSDASSAPKASIDRVAADAERLGLDIEIRRMDASTRTAADAAAACGCDVAQIVKSLVFANGDGLVLVLVSGAHNADLPAVSARTGRELARCDARRVRDVTGFAIGGVAPIGHLTALPVVMDEALLAHDVVWCAAGRPDSVFSVAPAMLRDAIGAEVVSVKAGE